MPLRRESYRLKLDFRGDARKAALWLVLGFHPLLETSCLKRALRDFSTDESWVKLFQGAFEIVEPAPRINLAWKNAMQGAAHRAQQHFKGWHTVEEDGGMRV